MIVGLEEDSLGGQGQTSDYELASGQRLAFGQQWNRPVRELFTPFRLLRPTRTWMAVWTSGVLKVDRLRQNEVVTLESTSKSNRCAETTLPIGWRLVGRFLSMSVELVEGLLLKLELSEALVQGDSDDSGVWRLKLLVPEVFLCAMLGGCKSPSAQNERCRGIS